MICRMAHLLTTVAAKLSDKEIEYLQLKSVIDTRYGSGSWTRTNDTPGMNRML